MTDEEDLGERNVGLKQVLSDQTNSNEKDYIRA